MNTSPRLLFLRSPSIALLLIASGWARAGEPVIPLPPPANMAAVEAAKTLLDRGPVIQRVTADGASFLGKPVPALLGTEVIVRVSPEGGKPVEGRGKFIPERDSFFIRISSLPADTVCRYTVSVAGTTAGPFTFMTMPRDGDESRPFRMVVYGDTRSNPDDHKAVADAILRDRPRLVLISGDLVSQGTIDALWDTEYFGPARALAAHVPILPALGNHEEHSPTLRKLFDLPGETFYHAADAGPVRILTLDSYDKFDGKSAQTKWLEEEIARPRKNWLIAQMHVPPHVPHPSGTPGSLLIPLYINLAPLLERLTPDIAFCGHNHYYARLKPIAPEAGARGITYVISARGGAPEAPLPELPFVAVKSKGLHHVVVDVSAQKIEARAVTPDGVTLDTFTIPRKGPLPDTITKAEVADTLTRDIARNVLWEKTKFMSVKRESPDDPIDATVEAVYPNLTPRTLSGKAVWEPAPPGWTFDPPATDFTVAPGKEAKFSFRVRLPAGGAPFPVPALLFAVDPGGQRIFRHRRHIRVYAAPGVFAPAGTAPRVNGSLTDAVWSAAATLGAFTMDYDGTPPDVPTTVQVLRGPDGLYFAADCADDNANVGRARAEARDSKECLQDEHLNLLISQTPDGKDFRSFVVTGIGILHDARNRDPSWNGAWTAATRKNANGKKWTAEIRIPWADLGFDAAPPTGTKLGLNVFRMETSPGRNPPARYGSEISAWGVTYESKSPEDKLGTLVLE
ncbi:MAG: metallophosphoesterase [Planctomycetota bacterium]